MTPLVRPDRPDFQRFLQVVRRQGGRDYVPFFELVIGVDHFAALSGLEPPCALDFCPSSPTFEPSFGYYFRVMAQIGFDHGTINLCGFPGMGPAARSAGDHVLCSDADFEVYAWPSVRDLDVDAMQRTAALAPEGMGVLTGSSCVFTALFDLLGYDGLCYALHDNRALVQRIADTAGGILLDVVDLVTQLPFIEGYIISGDMGFKTGPMVSPADLREFVFPWHKRIVAAIHRNGKIALRHTCGNLACVYDDLIDVGWDGRHSFEDAIEPGILELHERYGSRICSIGGIDVDFVCRASKPAIRQRVRDTIDALAPNGGWFLGTGNSVPDWMPTENYRALLDEGLRYGR